MRFQTIDEINAAYAAMCGPDVCVPGSGPRTARIMFIGEAPGADELKTGRPFTGQAGRNFDEGLETAGLSREDIYITNTVKYRPHRIGPSGRVSNRPPTRAEIEQFTPLLLEEIRLIAPDLLVTLGSTPLHAVSGDFSIKIGDVHGEPLDPGGGRPRMFPVYHPASIIYSKKLHEAYAQDWQALGRLAAAEGLL